MSHIQFIDELAHEYLLYRGFCNTLKAFDSDLKADRDKGFRVDKIVDQILNCVINYDLSSLRELWSHLDQRMFSRLEHHFTPAVRKLEMSILKMYVVNTAANNRPEKMSEFFCKMSSELQGQVEWKDWFALPYIKNPEENAIFAVYFTKHWQDTLLASLHNFFAIIFQSMPLPTLASYEEETVKAKRVSEEVETLRSKLCSLGAIDGSETRASSGASVIESSANELMDDFYIIAQEMPSNESQTNPFKTLIRNIGGGGVPTSPIMARKQPSFAPPVKKSSSVDEKRISLSKERVSPNWNTRVENLSSKKELKSQQSTKDDGAKSKDDEGTKYADETSPFLLLSQETYCEHRAAITQCHFNSSGSLVASGDADGVVKVWSTSPSPKTLTTFTCKSSIVALDWLRKHDRFFVLGTRSGSLHLCDSTDRKVIWELGNQAGSPLKDSRIIQLCCSPTEAQFVCSTATRSQTSCADGDISSQGRLLLFDVKTRKLERSLPLVGEGANSGSTVLISCCTFNHNGQLLVTGATDGVVRIFDLRRAECVDSWLAHLGSVLSLQLSVDYTSCYTLGQDGKFCQRSLNQSGHRVWETSLADPIVGGVQGQLFTFDQSGKFVLMCGRSGEGIYQVAPQGLLPLMALNSVSSTNASSTHPTAVDWCSANDCSTCLAGLADGRLRITTLLQQ